MRARTWVIACAVGLVCADAARADHHEVFLIAGQSNADGRGKAAELTGPLAKWRYPSYQILARGAECE